MSSEPKAKLQDNKIKQNAKYLRAITENMPGGVAIVDYKGKILYASPSGERVLGYSAEEMTGENILELVEVEHREKAVARLQELIGKPGHTTSSKYKVRCRDGTYRLLQVTGTNFIRDPNMRAIVINYHDITEREKSAERKKLLDEAMSTFAGSLNYENVLERIANITIPTIADWCAIYTVEKTGYLKRNIVAHKDPQKAHFAEQALRASSKSPRVFTPITKVLETGESLLFENITEQDIKKYTKDRFHARITMKIINKLALSSVIITPIISRGKMRGFMVFAISDSSRNYDSQDLKFVREFTDRVAIALDNARMYREKKEANASKDEFLASLAHELRNPLAPILHSLEILNMEKEKTKGISEEIDTIERQIKNMTRLLDDLLDVSRITRGKLRLHKETVDVRDAVNRAVETVMPAISTKGHKLMVDIPEEPVYLEADPLRLEQIVVNLLDNAAKYTKDKGRINLLCKKEENEIVISVKDSGIGIDADVLPDIFETFTRVDKRVNSNPQGGLGIGLKLAKTLTEMQGGKIEAHSEGLGKGSEFSVRLPSRRKLEGDGEKDADKRDYSRRETDTPTEDENISKTQEAERFTAPGSVKNKILIVDDNQDAANTLNKVLGKMGYEVELAYDGEEALKKAKKTSPKLMLLDIGLPGISGYEVARKIRAQKWSDGMVLAALTGYGQQSDKDKAKEAGFDWHITKPVGIADLKNILEKELS